MFAGEGVGDFGQAGEEVAGCAAGCAEGGLDGEVDGGAGEGGGGEGGGFEDQLVAAVEHLQDGGGEEGEGKDFEEEGGGKQSSVRVFGGGFCGLVGDGSEGGRGHVEGWWGGGGVGGEDFGDENAAGGGEFAGVFFGGGFDEEGGVLAGFFVGTGDGPLGHGGRVTQIGGGVEGGRFGMVRVPTATGGTGGLGITR